MKYSAVAAIGAVGIALSGCATIVEGTSQSIAITTPPTTGAYCTLSSIEGNWTVLTPGVATVEKSKEDIVAHCSKDGWQDASATIPADFQGWTVGNVVAGGLVGFGVDALSGALHKYPHAFEIPMRPLNGSITMPSAPAAVSQTPPQYAPTAPTQLTTNATPSGKSHPRRGAPTNVSTTIVSTPPSIAFADGTTAYEQGDYRTALSVWRPLADQGNAPAQQSLGIMYLHGYGVARDPNEAVQWLTKAANQGNVHACDNLGWMYEQGNGVKQDRVRAYMWYSRGVAVSSRDDSKLPKSNQDRVAATLTPEEIAQANTLAATTPAP